MASGEDAVFKTAEAGAAARSVTDILIDLGAPPGYHYEPGMGKYLPDGYSYNPSRGVVEGPEETYVMFESSGGGAPTDWEIQQPALPEHQTLPVHPSDPGGPSGVPTADSGPSARPGPSPGTDQSSTTDTAATRPHQLVPDHPARSPTSARPLAPARDAQTFWAAKATTAADKALEARLAEGRGTGHEALEYFQGHGYPELKTTPKYSQYLHLWIFPQEQPPLPPPLLPSGEVGPGWPGGVSPSPHEVPRLRDANVEAPRYVSTFFTETVSAGWRDAADENNPALLRYVLMGLLPVAEIGGFVERNFINPLLAAPANIVDAVDLTAASNEALARGDLAQAAEGKLKATGKLLDAAAAISILIPVGRGTALVEQGTVREIVLTWRVNWIGPKVITPSARASVVTQIWATRQYMEQVFKVDGTLTYVDGLLDRNGLQYVSKIEDLLIYEHKMSSKVSAMLNPDRWWTVKEGLKFFDQLNRLRVLNSELGMGGIRYVITEAVAADGTTPAATGLRAALASLFPEEFADGTIQVIRAAPPPATWSPWPGVVP